MRIHTEARQTVAANKELVFNTATDLEVMPRVFTGHGPVPAIERCENEGGTPTQVGTLRRVFNSDGSVIEEITREWNPPDGQAYELVAGFKPPFSFLVRSAGGNWSFTESEGSTEICWKFYFELTTPLVYPIALLVVRGAFTKAMQTCLSNIRELVESNSA